MKQQEKKTNKYGLSRYIPSPIKRAVRKACGFGCVICGMTIYTYEHIGPEFSQAKTHNPDKMALLCGSCHLKATKGLWSKNKVKEARKNPLCLRREFSSDFFDIEEPFGVSIGRIYFYDNRAGDLLIVDDETVLKIKNLKEEPPLLSGIFRDYSGKVLFKIQENEWIGSVKAWDIEAIGSTIKIRDDKNNILLQIRAQPPHILSIEKINLSYRSCTLTTNEGTGQITISTPNGTPIDASTGIAVTRGPVVIRNDNLQFRGGSLIMLGQKGLKMNPLDFENLLMTGRVISK